MLDVPILVDSADEGDCLPAGAEGPFERQVHDVDFVENARAQFGGGARKFKAVGWRSMERAVDGKRTGQWMFGRPRQSGGVRAQGLSRRLRRMAGATRARPGVWTDRCKGRGNS